MLDSSKVLGPLNPPKGGLNNIDTVIFDIDGTLVDTSKSYTAVIQETVRIYLSLLIEGEASAEEILSIAEISAFKQFGGFNNDWDTVAGVLLYYTDLIVTDKLLSITDLLVRKDIPNFIEELSKTNMIGLAAVLQVVNNGQELVKYEGDLKTTNLSQRIFQEIYYGSKVFRELYGEDPIFYLGEGYYKREILLVDKARLTQLAKIKQLAIATGRIGVEAEMVLKDFGIYSLFSAIVTDSDVSASQRKPDPAMLYLAAQQTDGKSLVYIGDLPDDVKAANAAKANLNIVSVCVGDNIPEADYCFKDVNAFISDML